jgi:hypothetical protein
MLVLSHKAPNSVTGNDRPNVADALRTIIHVTDSTALLLM